MSEQVRSLTGQQPNSDTNIKKKKLALPDELLNDITQFKRMFSKQIKQHKVSEPAAARLDASVAAVVPMRRRPAEDDALGERGAADHLARYAAGLRRLDRAKEEHIGDLERFLAVEDRVIASLRTGIEREHDAYAALRERFCRSFRPGAADGPPLSGAVSRALREFRAACDGATEAAGRADDGACRATVDALLSDVRSLAELARDLSRREPSDGGGGGGEDDAVADVARRLAAAGVRPLLAPAAVQAIAGRLRGGGGGGRRSDVPALWRAVRAMYDNNGKLDAAASALDRDTERLQEALCRANADRMALAADKADKACESIALDEFCVVTGRMTAHHVRSLEFGRALAVDERQIAEERDKIERLKAKIRRKQKKQQRLVQETDSVKGQLEEQRRKCVELERARAHLAADLADAKRSPEFQRFGQRVKNLKQLKVQYRQLTNTRDGLKLKLEKRRQVSRTPVTG